MKKQFSILLSILLFLSTFTSCFKNEEQGTGTQTTFSITIQDVEGGTLVSDKTEVSIGESVTFTMTADTGNILDVFTLNDGTVKVLESETKGTYVWTLQSVLSDVTVGATFVNPNGNVSFQADGGICDVESKAVVLKQNYGELPTPYCVGKRFIGWFDEQDNLVLSSSKVTRLNSVLTAKWEEFSDGEMEGLEPYSITSTYYDKDATKYGVVWHTENKPIAPVVQIVEVQKDADADFTTAKNYACVSSEFISHYISTGILDELSFDTAYAVRVGDIAAETWSKTYYFTTRKEVVEKTNFLYVTDTQEMYDFNSTYDPSASFVDCNGNIVYETGYQNVLKEALTRFPETDFIAHGGDMINYGGSELYVKEMLDSVQDYSFAYPTQVTSGNHEQLDGGAGIENMSVLFHYDSVSTKLLEGDLYSFDYGYVHFVVLRSNDIYNRDNGDFAKKLDAAQMQWLENDLANVNREKTPWVICMMHESFVTLTKEESANALTKTIKNNLAQQLLPLTTKYNVDLLLFGHDHKTISTYPIVSDNSADSVVYYGNRLKATTTTVNKVLCDGVTIDEFDFTNVDPAKRGTVYHQAASASGEDAQIGSKNKWSDRFNTGISFLRTGYTCGSGSFTDLFVGNTLIDAENSPAVKKGVNYSAYSYIEATEDTLILRTYGVDCRGLVAKTPTQANTDFGIYFEGFKLQK